MRRERMDSRKKIIIIGSTIISILLIISAVLIYRTVKKTNANNLKVLFGANRYETAVEISKSSFDNSPNVILASGEGFADALSGGQLANALNAPILLTNSKRLQDDVWKEIQRLKAENIYILGGNLSVSKDIEKRLSKYVNVIRIAGRDRYKTSYKIMKETQKHGKYDKLVLANGESFPDALSASNYVCANDYLLLLTDGKKAPGLKMETIAVGGKQNMPLEGFSGQRISGRDRYETAFKIAKECYENPDNVILASGEDYPDALTSISLIEKYKSPIILTEKDNLKKAVRRYINKDDRKLIVVGGNNSVNLARICGDILSGTNGKNAIKRSAKNVNVKDLSNVDYLKYVGVNKEKGVKYPDGKISGIYRFFNGYGDIVVTQDEVEVENYDWGYTYKLPTIWYCKKGGEPEVIAHEDSMDATIDNFKVIKKGTGYFLGAKFQFSAGGSGAKTDLFGIAFDKNGKYLSGPYTPNAKEYFDYFDIVPGQSEVRANIEVDNSGTPKLVYGGEGKGIKPYSNKLAGSYCIDSYILRDQGHQWDVIPVTIVPDSNKFAIVALNEAGNTASQSSSQGSSKDYFSDKDRVFGMKMPAGYSKNIAYSVRTYRGAKIYDFYIKKARAQFERKNNTKGQGGEVLSVGVMPSNDFYSDSELAGNEEEMAKVLSIGTVTKNGTQYEIFVTPPGTFDVAPDNASEEQEYEAWAEKCHKALLNIQGVDGGVFEVNEKNQGLLGLR